ncbi:MAG: tetratricopeptide repeat protein [Candidatus Lokiarchaeota archaeon]|jgi:tetratricopeptide (TPR) repeat protein
MSENYLIKLSNTAETDQCKALFDEKRLYTFFVGAGISMDPPSNVPSARMFVKELFKFYAPKNEIDNLSKLESLRYEFLVEKIQNLFDKDLIFLDYLDEVRDPNANHIFLAYMILRYNYVITTNFDYLIELALKSLMIGYPSYDTIYKKVMSVITKDDYKKNLQFQYPIVKIHGSKRDGFTGRDTANSLITTVSALGKEREKGKTFAIEPFKKNLIDSITQDRDLVVMGYSGNDDFDISPMLRELTHIRRIIWIDHTSDPELEEYYQYKPLDPLKLNSFSNLPKLDTILFELASKINIEVYKVKVKTIRFIKQRLAKIFHVSFSGLKEDISRNRRSFKDFMERYHFEKTESYKFRLAHEIYSDLGDIELAEKTAITGLDLANEENNDINKMYFTNALGLLFLDKGDTEKALKRFNETLQLTETLYKPNERIGILLNIGEYYRKKGDLKNALKYIFEASDKASDKTPNLLKYSIYNSLGVIYRANGDVQNAIKHLEMALEVAEKMGDLFRKSSCYNSLAGVYFYQGRLEPALKNASEALKIDELLGDLDDMASNLNTIGNIYRIAGQYNQALTYLERAYMTAEKIKKLKVKSLAANSIGVIYFTLGKLDMALKMYNETYEIRKSLGDISGKATILNNIGLIHRAKRDYKTANEMFTQSIEIAEEIGEKIYLGVRYANRASIFEATREFEKALEEYEKALTVEKSQQNLHGIATQLMNIGGILGDLGRYEECIQNYNNALNIMEELNIKPGIAQALNNLGSVHYKFYKDYEKAIPLLEKALEIYREINNHQMINLTQQNLIHIKKQYESN